eukprot:CAMPEP_0183715196 /NCGR_PEP_ID=MMETSP0737-20130205/9531_1 /TAXON_ID=385413 /ORGANISM="Thalassiosira miniscula, Strain CCMP1093" /LENGTH=676 /DNA_ID=CAMNT_0025944285 /DNA_START=1 /DNA_END=2027 /DNA_ORIENTATION=+
MSPYDEVRGRVAAVTFASLVRLAGGGYARSPTMTTATTTAPMVTPLSAGGAPTSDADSPADTTNNKVKESSQNEWIATLRQIAYTSVSFPNGLNTNNCNGNEGNPHDVEVRAAPKLFHCILQRTHYSNTKKRGGRKRKKKHNRKCRERKNQKVTKDDASSKAECENAMKTIDSADASSASLSLSSRKEEASEGCSEECEKKEFNEFGILSDMGTHRTITSVGTLGDLLALELERELIFSDGSSDHTNSCSRSDNMNSSSTNSGNSDDKDEQHGAPSTDREGRGKKQQSSSSIKRDGDNYIVALRSSSNGSGILHLLSSHRSRQLTLANRLPCQLCTTYCRGQKGLWWHMLKAHGVDYEMGKEAGSENGLAIVLFEEKRKEPTMLPAPIERRVVGRAETEHAMKGGGSDDGGSGSSLSVDANAFDMVKAGKLNDFVNLVENGSFQPQTHLDRNGASVLHWSAGCGQLHFVSYLVEKCQCSPDVGQVGKRAFGGRTPLHWAARNGHLNVVNYLLTKCNVDIDARTLDGTTAFCWASWQGHLEIMKRLYHSGSDIHTSNSFGCNAVLWSAQGTDTSEALRWLFCSNANFMAVNSNGHSALHKAAQRGNIESVRWLVHAFLLNKEKRGNMKDKDDDAALFIGPDMEGHCPSDLCGMEGHEGLARWIADQECEYCVRTMTT